MKNWSLGYEIIRTYVRFALWLTHKRIVVTGQHLIPKGKPIIFAANHQNALMDPLAVACTNPLQSVWLARADIFKSKIARFLLTYIKMVPVYRIRDGKDNLSNNEQIFQLVTHILEDQLSVALFPEAAHSGRRQMLPHRKAIPRIALEAENKNHFELNLQIQPVGIYYTHYWKFNRLLIVVYGEPIGVDEFKDEYTTNSQKAMLSLRDLIYDRITPLTLQINSENQYQEYENLRKVAGKTYSKTQIFSKNKYLQHFYADKELIRLLEIFETAWPKEFSILLEKLNHYFDSFKTSEVSDDQIEQISDSSWLKLWGRLFISIVSLPIFAFGFTFNALPFLIPRHILRRKVKNITFLSTFNFGAGLIVFPLAYLLEAALILVLSESWIITIPAFILMPFAGKYAWQLLGFYQNTLHDLLFLTGKKTYRQKMNHLVNQRKQLIDQVIRNVNSIN
jgi:1-acyl-sn-glycerol-3-phosphate acyltransferase